MDLLKICQAMFANFTFPTFMGWIHVMWESNSGVDHMRQNQLQEKSRDLLGVVVRDVDLPANTEHVHNPYPFLM